MGDALWLSAFVVYFLGAVLSRHWLILIVPPLVIPIAYYGLYAEWWGCCGIGDAQWWEFAAIHTAAVVIVAAALIGIARLAARTVIGVRIVNIVALTVAIGALAVIIAVVP
jgi:hypothetical protein